jgi:hypothetical protein
MEFFFPSGVLIPVRNPGAGSVRVPVSPVPALPLTPRWPRSQHGPHELWQDGTLKPVPEPALDDEFMSFGAVDESTAARAYASARWGLLLHAIVVGAVVGAATGAALMPKGHRLRPAFTGTALGAAAGFIVGQLFNQQADTNVWGTRLALTNMGQ